MSITRRSLLAASLLLAFALPTFASPKPINVTLGFIAKSDKDAEKDFAGLFRHLRASPDIEFTIRIFPTYEEVYQAFKEKKIDLALVGAVKYAQAHFETGAIPIVAEGGLTRAYIIVPNQSPIKTTKELKGKHFGFGYPDSTSTHLMPLLLLSKNLIKEKDLGKVDFLGADQEKLVERLLAGEVDAVSVVESVYRRHTDKVRSLERSDPFPGSPLIARKDASPKVIEAVRKTFLSYKGTPGDKRFSEGSISIDDSKFNMIRFLCKVLYGKMYV
ncbi:MAG TPA: PhnD/SsuA/transferrin family substrate-binding protein [Thermoanaerobaculia bacterium]|nr:PhnD/SsuA/transferrin family substrate-binding protein [Thermoanaerobaculia bacterium]